MLYVFSVDTGTVLTFDMSVALETVSHLKDAIHKACKVPPEKQVLLVSGGESLELSQRVCSYSAGTDTNPIFLFCKNTIESPTPPSLSTNQSSAQELRDRLETCLADRETTYSTVAARALLAQQLHDSAREQLNVCEQLVHDQHMQQQGWAAGVANLEDIVMEFRGRAEIFRQAYSQYLDSRPELLDILTNFSDDLQMLSDIPVLPNLMKETPVPANQISLLDWMRLHEDEQTNLNLIADLCSKGLEQLDGNLLHEIRTEVEGALKVADHLEMKEIRGLGERLFGLEQLLQEARRIVLEQGDLAQSFQQNQQRAKNLNDPSVLPDLCAFHRQHLKVMVKNDDKLRDIRSRCSRAKEELSSNLHHRLRWMMYVQRKLAEVDGRLCLHHENLRRLRRHLDLLKQLHNAPTVYFKSLIEIVRRKQFSGKFHKWACSLAGDCHNLHVNELSLRSAYRQLSENHFLTVLFPGMEDTPSSFATTAPLPFDVCLPEVTLEDLEKLKQMLPTLWALLELPNDLKKTVRDPFFSSPSPGSLTLREANQPAGTPSSGVLPSLSAALLSPPLKVHRSQNSSIAAGPHIAAAGGTAISNAVSRSLGDFQRTDFFIDDSLPSPNFQDHCHTAECADSQRKLEEQLEDHRCSLLNAQAQLQCVLEAGQTVLPVLKGELLQLRTLYSSESFWNIVQDFKEHLVKNVKAFLDNMEREKEEKTKEMEEKINKSKETNCRLEEENEKLKKDVEKLLEQSRRAMEDLVKKFQTEKEDVIKQKEVEWEEMKSEMTQKLNLEHELEVESLQEELRQRDERVSVEQQNHQLRITELERKLAEAIFARADAEQMRLDTLRRELLLEHEMELEQLRQEKEDAIREQEKLRDEMLREKEEMLHKEHQLNVQKIQEDLQHKHKLEIEGLRSRFRMMASATLGERTPSESALENLEHRGTPPTSPRVLPRQPSDIGVAQMEDVRSALEDQSKRWEERLIAEKEALLQLIEKGKQSTSGGDQTWWRDSLCRALTESNSIIRSLRKKVEELQREVDRSKLSSPLTRSISQGGMLNMAASVAVIPELPSTSSSSEPTQKKVLSKRSRLLIKQGSANVYGCEKGDTVLVQWDDRYSTYMLFNKGPYLHFLHTDSIEALGLSSRNGEVEPFLAKAIQKEFCLVRKDENRYKLPKGTNFYRVKVERLDLELKP